MKRRSGAFCALLALLAVQLVMHMNVDNLLLDDWVFYAVREAGESVSAWLSHRWMTWSSRLLIEGALCWLTHSIWAFRVLDSMVMALLAWALCRLANADRRPGMLALSGLLVTAMPFAVLRSTGWMATSLNYYWPLAATAVALIPLADSLWGRPTGRVMSAAAVACAVFGANQEQMSAVLAGAYLALGGWRMIRRGRVRGVHAAILAIALAELAGHLLCPGNALRAQQSVALVNLRDYGQFTLVDKLSIGLTSTAALLIYTVNPVLLATGAVVAGAVCARRRGLAALLPAALLLLCQGIAWLLPHMGTAGGWLAPFAQQASYVLQLGPAQIAEPAQWAMMALTVMLLGLMALTLYVCVGHRPLSAACVLVLAIGFAARMALAFSPTVVESGERTMLPLYGAMMLCSLLCARGCRAEGARRWPLAAALLVCALLAGANVLGSFALAA